MYRIHPGRLALQSQGCSVTQLAAVSDLSTGAVSMQLAGHSGLSSAVRDAMVELIGERATAVVVTAIPREQEATAA